MHGPNGAYNLLDMQNGGSEYNTAGYPNFPSWPNRHTATHVTAYYKWMHRAHLSGLKILATHVTGNPFFCQILAAMELGQTKGGCSAVEAVALQTKYISDSQDYVDAQ